MAQNNKVQILFDQLQSVDYELENKLKWYRPENGQIDVFTIQEIRTMIRKDYMHSKIIDDFRVYKESMYKIKLILKIGIAVQALEWRTNENQLRLKETPILKSDLEMLKKS
jgi:hypothetical protein